MLIRDVEKDARQEWDVEDIHVANVEERTMKVEEAANNDIIKILWREEGVTLEETLKGTNTFNVLIRH